MSAKPVLAAFSMHAFLILSFPLFIRSVALSGEIDCLKCHDKSMFTGKVVHPALGMGCTSCHNPHSANRPNLYRYGASSTTICVDCHK